MNLNPLSRLSERRKITLSLIFLLLITFLIFSPAINNDFTNWDDPEYVTENTLIRDLSSRNLKKIFTEVFATNYNPLVFLSFAVEYHFFQLDPRIYHLTNVLIHGINVILVFGTIYALTKQIPPSLLTALFFGIHPLRVESVAWVAERKDVLMAFFFLSALMSYLFYLRAERKRFSWWLTTFILFLLAVLSKSAAVIFPAALFLFDSYHCRKLNPAVILEKIPFFTVSLIFGLIALEHAQTIPFLSEDNTLTGWQRLIFAAYQIGFYFWKTIFPVSLSARYPYRFNELTGLFCLAVLVYLFMFLVKWRNHHLFKVILWGGLFFLINIVLVLPISPRFAIALSDRYMYLPSIGLFFLMIQGIRYYWNHPLFNQRFLKSILISFFAVYTAWWGFLTFQRNLIWRDSEVLWTDVIQKFPQLPVAYQNRGEYFLRQKRYSEARRDFVKAVELYPQNALAYNNLGVILAEQNAPEGARDYFIRALSVDPYYIDALNNRGNAYILLKRWDLAKSDFDRVLSLNDQNVKGYVNRGHVYRLMKEFDLALKEFQKAQAINPGFAEIYLNRGTVYGQKGEYEKAIQDYSRAIEINPELILAYYNRAVVWALKKNWPLARGDFNHARRLGLGNQYVEQFQKIVSTQAQ